MNERDFSDIVVLVFKIILVLVIIKYGRNYLSISFYIVLEFIFAEFYVLFFYVMSFPVFSERELKFMFAICHRRSVCRLSSVVCRLSVVCNVGAPYSGD